MKILGISGKKQSGKNSTANFIIGKILKDNGIVFDYGVTDKGELSLLTSLQDGSKVWGTVDTCSRDPVFLEAAENMIFPFVKNYSFADSLKEAAVSLFGLTPEQAWGTDKDKQTLTNLKWENMPGVTTEVTPQDPVDEEVAGRLGKYYEKVLSGVVYHEPGFMTAREFLQFFGTEIGRKMYPDIWIDATINRILEEQTGLAIITDVRFPDEVAAIQNVGGIVCRLDRTLFEDNHPSEVALDKENYDWNNFDFIIENHYLPLEETCKLMAQHLEQQGLV